MRWLPENAVELGLKCSSDVLARMKFAFRTSNLCDARLSLRLVFPAIAQTEKCKV